MVKRIDKVKKLVMECNDIEVIEVYNGIGVKDKLPKLIIFCSAGKVDCGEYKDVRDLGYEDLKVAIEIERVIRAVRGVIEFLENIGEFSVEVVRRISDNVMKMSIFSYKVQVYNMRREFKWIELKYDKREVGNFVLRSYNEIEEIVQFRQVNDMWKVKISNGVIDSLDSVLALISFEMLKGNRGGDIFEVGSLWDFEKGRCR